MGLPGSESSLEELLSKVLGDLIMDGHVVKLADDLYAGADDPQELLEIWSSVLEKLSLNGLKLSPVKTVICPKSTEVLGWIWEQGTLRASPHRLNALLECSPPDTVRGLRSYVGAYKSISKVLPAYSAKLSPLDQVCAGAKSLDKISWSDDLLNSFDDAKAHLKDAQVLTLPRRDDQLQIICDASKSGLASALYIIRDKPYLAGIFNVQLKGTQKMWLPCELEALSIGCGVRHFGPFLIQSKKIAEVLTDSKPCVEAYGKLQRGSFSASARVTSFLSIISRYGVKLSHIAGQKNILSDYFSRNALECEGGCQICKFVAKSESAVVHEIQVSDVISGSCAVPFTTRSTWYQSQQDCPTLKEVAKYLTEGRSPPRKKKGMKEIKRYLNVVKVSTSPNDGLLIVPQEVPLGRARHRIVVPRDLLDGLLTALHLHLNHPSKYQLKQVFSRGFFALDADKAVERTVDGCHTCAALKKVPTQFKNQSSTVPVDEAVGKRYAVDVVKRQRQLILLMKEYVSSYSDACFIQSETAASLQDGIIRLMSRFRSPSGPPVIVRVDPGKGFESIAAKKSLSKSNVTLEVGAPKNVNKNPVAEKSVSEFHAEIARLIPSGGPIDEVTLSLAIGNMNSRIRHGGLSATEVWHQRDMFTGVQLPIKDLDVIRSKADVREKGHLPSAKYKARGSVLESSTRPYLGEIVYIYQDRDKTRSRDRYIVVKTDRYKTHCQKFTGNQIRSKVYIVDNADVIKVKSHVYPQDTAADDSSDEWHDADSLSDQEVMQHDDADVTMQLPHQVQLPAVDDTHQEAQPDAAEDISIEFEGQVDGSSESEDDDDSEVNDASGEVRDTSDEDSEESSGESNDTSGEDNDTSEDSEETSRDTEEPEEQAPRRSGRDRKATDKFQAYYTGKRLSEVVPMKEGKERKGKKVRK